MWNRTVQNGWGRMFGIITNRFPGGILCGTYWISFGYNTKWPVFVGPWNGQKWIIWKDHVHFWQMLCMELDFSCLSAMRHLFGDNNDFAAVFVWYSSQFADVLTTRKRHQVTHRRLEIAQKIRTLQIFFHYFEFQLLYGFLKWILFLCYTKSILEFSCLHKKLIYKEQWTHYVCREAIHLFKYLLWAKVILFVLINGLWIPRRLCVPI